MIELRSADFPAALDELGKLGLRVDMIMPADDPRIAELSKGDVRVRLVCDAAPRERDSAWHPGRAGMEYRDLIPDRCGGRLIASHIRVRDGGPVPDYVHYHQIGLQIIYCLAGWVRLVYEDQGEPFVMRAGECVLQPPTIRHRVLECSPGLEVIEVASPAEHPTYADHEMKLPNGTRDCEYGGQRFARDRDVANVRVRDRAERSADGGLHFGFVLRGAMTVDGKQVTRADAFVDGALSNGSADLQWLEVLL